MSGKKIVSFIACLLIPMLIGFFSSFLTRFEVDGTWFNLLKKPYFNPPNWLFAPVWTTLFLLMGIGLYFIWNSGFVEIRKKAILVFSIQLFLNFCWSILFFYSHLILASVIDILLLWISICYMIILFRRIKPIAGYLQIPYLAWVTFASVLDISIWFLNK